jgi:hypothetical protein
VGLPDVPPRKPFEIKRFADLAARRLLKYEIFDSYKIIYIGCLDREGCVVTQAKSVACNRQTRLTAPAFAAGGRFSPEALKKVKNQVPELGLNAWRVGKCRGPDACRATAISSWAA